MPQCVIIKRTAGALKPITVRDLVKSFRSRPNLCLMTDCSEVKPLFENGLRNFVSIYDSTEYIKVKNA